MAWGLAALAAGSIVSGLIGSRSASKASSAQAGAADRSAEMQLQAQRETNALQERIYNETVARNEPARQIGQNALGQLAGMSQQPMNFQMGQFEASPGYQFRLQEGQDALNRQASASGMRLSGAGLKDAMAFNQGMASEEFGAFNSREMDRFNRERAMFGDRFNRTASVAGVGQTATGAIDSAGRGYAGAVGATNTATAGNVGNALMAGGQARASGYMGQANAFNNALSGIGTGIAGAYGGYFGQNPGFGITPIGNPYAQG